MSIYLQQLTVRLAEGVGRMPESTRQLHTDYFLAAQQPDGGFAGREGGSDLYYTTFCDAWIVDPGRVVWQRR